MVSEEHRKRFNEDGYAVVKGVFSPVECAHYIEHFMRMREAGSYPGDTAGVDIGGNDPLKKYPRLIHMHRWDDISLRWLVDARLNECMTALMGSEPFAVQTMLYFKPPGARGQALHQDQFYLKVQPGTCMAAWLPLERCDEDNGCLQIVPGSHALPVLCTTKADVQQSFTDVTVPVPEGMPVAPVVMDGGDVMFFNGQLIHGSYPNRSTTRFRRALIGHYIVGEAEKVAKFYHPIYRMDGTVVELGVSEGGGPCGVWVERDGRHAVELRDPVAVAGLPEHE